MFAVKAHTRGVVQVGVVDRNENETDTYEVEGIKIHLSLCGVKETCKHFPLRLAFAGMVHKEQGQTLKKLIVDPLSSLFSSGKCTWLFIECKNLLICFFFTTK